MKRSTDRILTTHVGSLPYLKELEPGGADYEARLHGAVRAVVQKQRDIGIDIVNEGEYTKEGDWLSFVEKRFAGYEPRPPKTGQTIVAQGQDRAEFADFYDHAAKAGTLFFLPGNRIRTARQRYVCTGPVRYAGQAALAREIALLKEWVAPEEGFLTSTAPGSLEVYRENEFYKSEEEYVFAIAEAMREEYEAIAASGFALQVDDAWLPALWDRIGMQMGIAAFQKYCGVRVDALNHALRNIAPKSVRYHLCWGSWHGPHAFDIEMKDMVQLMLRVNAAAYSFEAANARHEHEYAVWESVRLPEGKVIMPGVITHSTDVVEHPELVAQRVERFAHLVGRENVIASADCGFGGRSHPQIAWAKLASLTQGAAIASKKLW